MSEVMQSIRKLRMPAWNANLAFREYARAAELHPEMPEYEDLAKLYRVMSRKGEILHLGQALSSGGLNDLNVPRLAIVRADAREVRYSREWKNGRWGHYFEMVQASKGVRGRSKQLWLPMGTIPGDAQRRPQGHSYSAIAPLIPPRYLPKAGLHNYYLLWEATWTLTVPVDPILMRHVSGMFYQPIFQWDLTELEQSVLRERLVNRGSNEPIRK